MNPRNEHRHAGSLPDRLAATAAAALALRDLVRFHQHRAAARPHDDAGILAWTAAVPAAAEIDASYRMLLETLAGAEIDSAAAEVAVLRLVEAIVADAALGRGPAAAGDMLAAARMLQSLGTLADEAVLGELVGDAMLGRGTPGRDIATGEARPIATAPAAAGIESPSCLLYSGPPRLSEGWYIGEWNGREWCDAIGALRAPTHWAPLPVAPPAATAAAEASSRSPSPRSASPPALPSLLKAVELWHQLGDEIDAAPGRRTPAQHCARANAESRIADTAARGDADLIAKAGVLRRLIEQDGDPLGRLGTMALSLLDDIAALVGKDEPPVQARGRL